MVAVRLHGVNQEQIPMQENLPKLDTVPRRMRAKHPGRCRRCSAAVKPGATVWWYPHNGALVHEACMRREQEQQQQERKQ